MSLPIPVSNHSINLSPLSHFTVRMPLRPLPSSTPPLRNKMLVWRHWLPKTITTHHERHTYRLNWWRHDRWRHPAFVEAQRQVQRRYFFLFLTCHRLLNGFSNNTGLTDVIIISKFIINTHIDFLADKWEKMSLYNILGHRLFWPQNFTFLIISTKKCKLEYLCCIFGPF